MRGGNGEWCRMFFPSMWSLFILTEPHVDDTNSSLFNGAWVARDFDLGLFEDRVQYGTVLPIPRNDEHFPILNTDFGCRIDKCIWLGRRAWEVNKHHKISPLSLHPEHLRLIRSKFMEFPSVFCIINYNGMSRSNLSTTDFSKPQNKTFHDFF